MPALVLVISNNLIDEANEVGRALKYGFPCFTVPLVSLNRSNVVAWACGCEASEQFIGWLEAGATGTAPEIEGVDPSVVEQVFDDILIASSDKLTIKQLFDLTLEEQGLETA